MRSARASPFETPARSQVYAGCACYGGLLRVRIEVVPGHHPHYIDRAGLHGSSGAIFSGPYRSLRELSLAGPWAGYMAPTYFRREPGIDAPTAIAAPHFLSSQHLVARCAHGAARALRLLPRIVFPERRFASVGHRGPFRVGRGFGVVVVVPVPPLVARRLGIALRRVFPFLLAPERRHVEIAPDGPDRLVAAGID